MSAQPTHTETSAQGPLLDLQTAEQTIARLEQRIRELEGEVLNGDEARQSNEPNDAILSSWHKANDSLRAALKEAHDTNSSLEGKIFAQDVALTVLAQTFAAADKTRTRQAYIIEDLISERDKARQTTTTVIDRIERIGTAAACMSCWSLCGLRALPCGHCFCAQCLITRWSQPEHPVACMYCNQTVHLSAPPLRAFKANDIIEALGTHTHLNVENREVSDDAWARFYDDGSN